MIRIVSQGTAARAVLLVGLPEHPIAGDATAHWLMVRGGLVSERGADAAWTGLMAERPLVIGLVPTAALRLAVRDRPDGVASDRQAEAIVGLDAARAAAAPTETLHWATAALPDAPSRLMTAVVANEAMLRWLEWSDGIPVSFDHLVPAAAALAEGIDGPWRSAMIGYDRLLVGNGTALVDEPDLRDAIVPLGGAVEPVSKDAIDAGLAALALAPRPDLRHGRFARRRTIIRPSAWRELALWAAAIALVTLLTAIVEIVRLNRDSDRLDAQTVAIAREATGQEVAVELAEHAVAARTGGVGGFSANYASALSTMQARPDVTVTALGHRAATTSVTLAAPDSQSVNAVLLDLQRAGYVVSAVPRQSGDGRTMADVTIRTVR